MSTCSNGKLIRYCLLVVITGLPILLGACGNNSSNKDSQSAKVAVAGDYNPPTLATFLATKGLTVEAFKDSISSIPDIDGTLVVWQDNRLGDGDIYAYDLTSATELKVSQDADDFYQETDPAVSGDLVVWVSMRNGNSDIYAIDLSDPAATEFKVNQDAGSAAQSNPAVSGNLIVWEDLRNGNYDIYGYNVATLSEFTVVQSAGDQRYPAISGSLVVWQDDADGDSDIYATDLSPALMPVRFQIGQSSDDAYQQDPAVSGNLVVWQDNRNGNNDIYGYYVDTASEVQVSQDPGSGSQTTPDVSGSLVVWTDFRNGNYDIYARDLASMAGEFMVSQDPGTGYQANPAVSGGKIVWTDRREDPFPVEDVFLFDTATDTETNISIANKATLHALASQLDEFDMILFGDKLGDTSALLLFDAADAAGVPMLGIGTSVDARPLGQILADDFSRFGLSGENSDGYAAMQIDVTSEGLNHPIFDGIDTASTLILNSGYDYGDEQYYEIAPVKNAPGDWVVLANLGPAMDYDGYPAILEFTTPNGTRVMLDGSANTYDLYEYWTQERWDILYNQVRYLMESRK